MVTSRPSSSDPPPTQRSLSSLSLSSSSPPTSSPTSSPPPPSPSPSPTLLLLTSSSLLSLSSSASSRKRPREEEQDNDDGSCTIRDSTATTTATAAATTTVATPSSSTSISIGSSSIGIGIGTDDRPQNMNTDQNNNTTNNNINNNNNAVDDDIDMAIEEGTKDPTGDATDTVTSQNNNDNDNDNDSNDNDENQLLVVRGLRLEAIFHPKFDNERNKGKNNNNNNNNKGGKNNNKNNNNSGGDDNIRSAMLRKLGYSSTIGDADNGRGEAATSEAAEAATSRTGHLEVSLKHSGSLVLWSGSTRYYSKNSACNEFTRTAEILLRQRFETVRKAIALLLLAAASNNNNNNNNDNNATSTEESSSSNNSNNNNNNNNMPPPPPTTTTTNIEIADDYRSYEDCSNFISKHRYTIAFEVVTAEMLGDHGQIPLRDYVVVTAVADRKKERFLSTTEVLEFCHKYRLPHNDVWTFFPKTKTETETRSSKSTAAITSENGMNNNTNTNTNTNNNHGKKSSSYSLSSSSSSSSSSEALFQLYDNSMRETGYTDDTVQALTEIADVYVPSPIPHSIFQGSICEGFIVRYVEDNNDSTSASTNETAAAAAMMMMQQRQRQRLEGLAQTAQKILREIPPTSTPTPTSTVTATDVVDVVDADDDADPVLMTDLRALYRSIPYNTEDSNDGDDPQQKRKPLLSDVALQRRRAALFSERLQKILLDGSESDGGGDGDGNKSKTKQQQRRRRQRQRHDLQKIEKEENNRGEGAANTTTMATTKICNNNYHLPTLAKDLLESRDKETRRIATLLQTLDGLKGGAVTYTWIEKDDGDDDDNDDDGNDDDNERINKTTSQQPTPRRQRRLYCIIHVHNDSMFFKFQSLQRPTDMTLFRGFCVEVLLSPSSSLEEEEVEVEVEVETAEEQGGKEENRDFKIEMSAAAPSKEDKQQGQLMPSTTTTNTDVAGTPPLMLKMKLLPYMVRTFVCRNLMKTIHQKGPEEFERIAVGLLEKWKMSSEAQERWMPFFRGWALYVLQYKDEQEQKEADPNTAALSSEDANKNNTRSTSSGNTLLELGPLTNFSYLRHLEHFTKLYGTGKFQTTASTSTLFSSSPEFHTFVCIVSQSTEVSQALATHFANHFNETIDISIDDDKKATTETKMMVCSLGEAAKNRRTKSCVAYANVGDVTKGIKKFICDKKVAKQSILLLYGSNKDEIIAMTKKSTTDEAADGATPSSWLDISSEGEGKKLTSMWKPWKKFPCAERIALPSSAVEFEPKREDSIAAVIARMNDGMEETVDSIQAVGQSLIEQDAKKQSNPSRNGILVFFPGIPGCGKSSLLESIGPKLKNEMASRKVENGDIYDRDVHVKEGDKMGKNFWNVIEDLLSDDDIDDGKSPSLVIADKNAPPASWPKVGQIRSDSNGVLLPVLPDPTVLETTTIEGSIQPNGTLLPHSSHFYPFSLKFLAVSMSRVLSRPPGEHTGKLDSGFPTACMIVVQFYSFYRYIAADTFLEKLGEKLDKDSTSSVITLKPVQLPFLVASAQDQGIPDDLKKLLVEALQLRHGHDKNRNFKVKKGDPQMIELEARVRSSLEMHQETIRAMTVSLEDTREAFTLQVMDRIKSLSSKKDSTTIDSSSASDAALIDSNAEDDTSKNIKLVSLDIDRTKIHDLLQKRQRSGVLKIFFDSIVSSSPSAPGPNDSDTAMADAYESTDRLGKDDTEDVANERYPIPDFIANTHVTMAFAGENNSAQTLISNFRHLQGREVSVTVTGFLWNSTNAALAIKISSSAVGDDSISVPPCENTFAHVTVWCAPDVKSSLSNKLPALVESGEANRIDFNSGNNDLLVGSISFWNHDNEPIQV